MHSTEMFLVHVHQRGKSRTSRKGVGLNRSLQQGVCPAKTYNYRVFDFTKCHLMQALAIDCIFNSSFMGKANNQSIGVDGCNPLEGS